MKETFKNLLTVISLISIACIGTVIILISPSKPPRYLLRVQLPPDPTVHECNCAAIQDGRIAYFVSCSREERIFPASTQSVILTYLVDDEDSLNSLMKKRCPNEVESEVK